MHKIKDSLDFQSTTPFFLINKEKSVPSWLGAISTIIAWILAGLFCLSEIEGAFSRTKPNIAEEFFDPLSDGTDVSIYLDKYKFEFGVHAKDNSLLDETFYTPRLFLNYSKINWDTEGEDENERFNIDFYKCPDSQGLPMFCISPNQTSISKEKMKIFLNTRESASLNLEILPCQNSSEPNSKICQSKEDIYNSLNDANIEIYYEANLAHIQKRKVDTGTYTYVEVRPYVREFFPVSINNPKNVQFLYEVKNYTTILPIDSLISFFSPNNPSTLLVNEDIKVENLDRENMVFFGTFEFYSKIYRDVQSGKPTYNIEGKSYVISFKSIPELWASFSAMKELILFWISLILGLTGYFEGNYYSEIIYSFFGENENFSSMNRKKILNVYDKSNPRESELFPVSSSINNETNFDKEIEKETNRAEKLVNQRKIEFRRINKIWDGTITGLIKCCFCCTYFKSAKWKENHELFTQGKNVVDIYTDIIYVMKKNYEFELLKKTEEHISPKLFTGINLNDEENFYKNWIKMQKDPVVINSE